MQELQRAFDAYGGGLAIEAPDGEFLVMIPSYQRDTWGYVARFLKLSRTGEVRWELGLPVVATTGRSAEPEKISLSEAGTLRLHGFVYGDDKFEKIEPWDGEIDMAGKLLRESRAGDPRSQRVETSIGSAHMLPDGTIVLNLRAQTGGAIGDAQFRYPKDHPRYRKILEHLGGLEPGQDKPVPPWPDER